VLWFSEACTRLRPNSLASLMIDAQYAIASYMLPEWFMSQDPVLGNGW
jgi:hypothetical protein